jgi:hypothetical protein
VLLAILFIKLINNIKIIIFAIGNLLDYIFNKIYKGTLEIRMGFVGIVKIFKAIQENRYLALLFLKVKEIHCMKL